jgi:hypothetical protein
MVQQFQSISPQTVRAYLRRYHKQLLYHGIAGHSTAFRVFVTMA